MTVQSIAVVINAYDAVEILRAFYEHKLGTPISGITVASWNQQVLQAELPEGITDYAKLHFGNGVYHRLRLEHSDLYNADGTPK